MQEAPTDYRSFPLLAGELNGRSYVVDYSLILPSTADRISALAAHSGGLVLGMGYQDTTGTSTVTAARGATLLRYAFDCAAGRHEEGAPLPGETPNAPAWTPKGFRNVLAALGFDVDGWLERGAKWDVLWTMLDAGEQPEAHERLYFGPLRQRIDELQNAALDGF